MFILLDMRVILLSFLSGDCGLLKEKLNLNGWLRRVHESRTV